MKTLPILLLTLLLLAGDAMAAPGFGAEGVKALAGRNVLLLVGPAPTTATWKAQYLGLLKSSGADMARYPVYQAASLPPELAAKLGVAKRAPGYATLVRWGNPARFGPARILDPGVINAPTSDADMFVLVESALVGAGQQALLEKLPESVSSLRPRASLAIAECDFQANGRPHFVVDTKVRITNSGKRPARGVTVVFLVEDPKDGTWFELGRQSVAEIKAGETATRDLVRTTHDTPLLNAENEVQPTKYRIRVESADGSVETTDQFNPSFINEPEPQE